MRQKCLIRAKMAECLPVEFGGSSTQLWPWTFSWSIGWTIYQPLSTLGWIVFQFLQKRMLSLLQCHHQQKLPASTWDQVPKVLRTPFNVWLTLSAPAASSLRVSLEAFDTLRLLMEDRTPLLLNSIFWGGFSWLLVVASETLLNCLDSWRLLFTVGTSLTTSSTSDLGFLFQISDKLLKLEAIIA